MEHRPSVVGSLFYGEIHEESTFPFPHFSADQKEMATEMVDAVNKFAHGSMDSFKMDQEGKIPEEVIQGLAALGLCGLAVPQNFGGLELDYTLYSRVFQEMAGIDGGVATTLGAHQSIGYRALLNEGTDEQKAKWLPKLASGEVFAAFCLTEPGSGSDAYSIKTKAIKNKDGTYTIKGQKLWITNGGMAGFYSVFCKTDHEVDGKVVEKISCFIVEKERAGMSFGEKENKMGIRCSETRAVYFDNVIVPAENMIGEPGKGFKIAMNVLNSGRLSLGAGCVGAMKKMIALSANHVQNRKQFDRPIAEFGLVQEKMTQMAALCYATENVVYMTTGNMVKGMEDYFLETAVCKIFGSESLWKVVDMSMQLAGGNGYMKEYPYERYMRDSRINLIFEGTNEILRAFLALSGIRGPSEQLRELGKIADVGNALQDPIKSLGVLTDFAKGRLTKMYGTRTLTKCHPDLADFAKNLGSMVSGFAIQVENCLLKYGKKIPDHELPQGRIANMAIHLYVILCTLSRTTAILEDATTPVDKKIYCLSLAKIVCRQSRVQFITNLKAMENNDDQLTKSVSEAVCKNEGYGLDIINF